jgi:succinate dehydrogenase/fumarate reductase cytochrome b subunit
MDQFLRIVAIFLEAIVLSAIIYCMLNGVRLALLDFGIGPKYSKAIVMTLAAAGSLLVVFFVAHLSTFYPTF